MIMRTVVIGGTGHIGTYLVPRLVEAGHEVINVSRGQREPYQPHAAWKQVQSVVVDREAADQAGTFGDQIRELRPDVVIDNKCYTVDSVRRLVEALQGQVQHLIVCGTIWVHGHSVSVPTTEEQPRYPFGEYGTNKAAVEVYLLDQARRHGFPATMLHPGHIVGPGWVIVNPAGNFNPVVFEKLARGEELALPNFGMETVHHVHAQDVAQAFWKALDNWSSAVGQSFHVVSPAALTLRGYAEAVAAWFGQPAHLSFMPFEQWRATVSEEDAERTWDHIAHSPNCSIAKAQRLLDYQPRYTSLQAVFESVSWLVQEGVVKIQD
jgi:nucleoside-diphosphate-sugar epimerase